MPKLIKKYRIEKFVATRHHFPLFNKDVKYIAIVHDLIPLRMPKLFTFKHNLRFGFFSAICKHKADYYIASSESTKYDIIKYFNAPQNRIEVIYMGANSSYNIETIFVYASLYEGFGIPILEAMQSGIPVITSNVSSLPEVAGDACRMVNPYNIDEIQNAIMELLTDESLRKNTIQGIIGQTVAFTNEIERGFADL